jgi:predicted NBD/HSP70 family sugar kinase
LATDDSVEANEVWEQVGRDFAQGLGALLPITGARRVIIVGSVSLCYGRFKDAMDDELDKMFKVYSDDSATKPPTEIRCIPPEQLHTIAARGAYFALQNRKNELVTIGPVRRQP